MIKYIIAIALVYAMTGCASTSPNTQSKQTLKTAKGYAVGDVNVTILGQLFMDFSEEHKHYPNEKELSTFFKEDIEKYLKQHGKFCQSTQGCLTLDLDLNYQRSFNIAAVSSRAPLIDRTITIYKDDTIVYSRTQKRLEPNKGGMIGNALNGVEVFTKAGEDKANQEDEREYIDIFSKVTVNDIIELAQ